MNDEMKVAFIQSQIVCANAKIESMKAENRERQSQGLADAYREDDFLAVPGNFLLEHNQVIGYLTGR